MRDNDIKLYVTSEAYANYIDTNNFPETINKEAYKNIEKIATKIPPYDKTIQDPDLAKAAKNKAKAIANARYSEATALCSNQFVALGGRGATISDYTNAIINGNKAAIVDFSDVSIPMFKEDGTINNASKYLKAQIDALRSGEKLPYGFIGNFTEDFVKDYRAQILRNTVTTTVDTNNVKTIAKDVAQFLAAKSASSIMSMTNKIMLMK